MSFVGVDSLPPLWCETPTSARLSPGLFLCVSTLMVLVAALPARAEPTVSPELLKAAGPEDTFQSLAARTQHGWSYQPVAYMPVQFNSWDMKDWPGTVPMRRRVVREDEPPSTLSERGRDLIVLGLAWLGKLSR
jgi:hypothetical protein